MAFLSRWMWVCVNSWCWWWTGRPGVLRFMGSQRVGHYWRTGLNWTEHYIYSHTLLKLMSIESVMSSNHVILCHSLLLLPSVFLHISVFSSQPALLIRYQNFGGSDSACLPINIWGWFPLGLTGLMSLQSKVLSRFFPSTTIQKHQFLSSQPSFWSKSHICTWLLEETWFWLYGPLLAQWCLCIKYYV